MRWRICAADGCEVTIERTRLMCRTHWLRVPKPLRDEVWAAFRAFQARPTIEAAEVLKGVQQRARESL